LNNGKASAVVAAHDRETKKLLSWRWAMSPPVGKPLMASAHPAKLPHLAVAVG